MLTRQYAGWSILIALLVGNSAMSYAQSNPTEVTSPDHRIMVRFDVQPMKGQAAGQQGQLVYSVSFREKAVFENSGLGLELANQPPLGPAEKKEAPSTRLVYEEDEPEVLSQNSCRRATCGADPFNGLPSAVDRP